MSPTIQINAITTSAKQKSAEVESNSETRRAYESVSTMIQAFGIVDTSMCSAATGLPGRLPFRYPTIDIMLPDHAGYSSSNPVDIVQTVVYKTYARVLDQTSTFYSVSSATVCGCRLHPALNVSESSLRMKHAE